MVFESVNSDEEKCNQLDPLLQMEFDDDALRKERNSRLSFGSDKPMMPVNSKYLSSFLLLNAMIGSGILNQPYVFMKAGVLGGVCGFLFASVLVWSSVNLLTDAGVLANIFEYSGLAKHAFGPAGERTVDCVIIFYCFGSLLGYIIVVGNSFSELLQSWGCDIILCDNVETTIISVALFVAPVCLFRHFGHLAILSVFSIFTIWTVLLLVVIAGPLKQHDGAVTSFNLQGTFSSFGSMVFALSIATANFQAYVSTEKSAQNKKTWKEVTAGAVFSGTVMCIAMGLAGYLSFRGSTEGMILDNFTEPGYDVFKLMVVLHLIFYVPVMFVIMRYSLVKICWGMRSELLPFTTHTVISLALLSFIVAMVLLMRAVGLASGAAFTLSLNVTGGIGGSLLSFILPAAIYMKLAHAPGDPLTWKYRKAQIIYVLGYVIMALVLTFTIADVIN